jgi:glycosyltransferase involved in cell wall biosynthesis
MIVMTICHYDDTNSSGGLDKQARLLSRTLRAAGEDVVVLGSTRKLSRAGWTLDQGVPVRLFWTYASPQVSGRYLPAALLWAVQLLVWVALHRRRIDLLHAHQIRIHAFVGALARRLFGIPSILKSATGGAGADIRVIGSRKYFGSWGRRFVVRNTDAFIATTESVATDLRQWGVPEGKIRLIPNGLVIEPPAGAAPDAERARRCVFLGRLAQDKNVKPLARAAVATAGTASISLDFYGAGPDAEGLAAIISQAGAGAVALKGWTPDPRSLLGGYGFLLLPSSGEGLSNAMIEAMAHGVVPVTTRVSGCVDHIRHGENGFFLEGTDEKSLADGLRLAATVSTGQWRRMSDAARRLAADQFDMSSVAGAYRALYRQLASRTQAAR